MHLPPLQSPFTASYHASGDVAIAPDAVIAPGVVLRADPNSKIVIGAGVCLGLGVVFHANQGNIIVEAGASVGAGVLGVGNCRIGTQACVGASTTLHNASVAPGQLVPPGSLLGDRGTHQGTTSASANGASGWQAASRAVTPDPSPWDEDSSASPQAAAEQSASQPPKMEEESRDVAAAADNGWSPSTSNHAPKPPKKVYGKDQFERMRTLFMPDQTV